MGYTHYWRFVKTPSRRKFCQAADEFRYIFEELLSDLISIGDVEGRDGSSPEIGDRGIFFNGIGTDGYEGFHMSPDGKVGDFSFCKTDEREYDVAVCTCLLVFKEVFGDDFIIETDGIVSDSENGKANKGWKSAGKVFNAYRNMSGKPEISDFGGWVD